MKQDEKFHQSMIARRSYKWDATDYERHSNAQQEWAWDLIAKLNLQGDERLLDIGCGDGKITAAIADLLPEGQAVGIDNSREMIELAKKRHIGSNMSFESLDIRDLHWKEQFNIVFSNAALHWIKQHEAVLKRVYNCMLPDARLLFQMGGHGNANDVVAVLDRLIRDRWHRYFKKFTFPYGFYRVEEYTRWLEATGFEPRRVELIPKDMRHHGLNALAGWIRTTWLPYLECLPSAHREEFIDAVVKNYTRRHPPDADGIIHVAMVRLEVEAVKANR